MKNLDVNLKEKAVEAIKNGDAEAQADVLNQYFENIANDLTQKFEGLELETDSNILKQRGFRVLTKDEKTYFEKVISAMKVNQALSDVDNVMPKTVITQIFDDLENNHPLLSKIDFVNVTGMTEFLVRVGDVAPAWWGRLCEEIEKELASSFSKESVTTYKLSAFLPICKAHLDLGPTWLEAFVRRFLTEALAQGLEKAIVTGTGKDEPIGMDRNLQGSVVDSVYPKKEAVELKDFAPKTIGNLIANLTNGGKRTVTSALMLVNPMDYYARIMPNVLYQNAQGVYVTSLPFPIEFIQSAEVEIGKAILGLGNRYFLGLGSTQKIEKSDEYHFLEDERVYLGKLYGTGKPKDNASFIYLDIQQLGAIQSI